jgi:hypothetical protein
MTTKATKADVDQNNDDKGDNGEELDNELDKQGTGNRYQERSEAISSSFSSS